MTTKIKFVLSLALYLAGISGFVYLAARNDTTGGIVATFCLLTGFASGSIKPRLTAEQLDRAYAWLLRQ